MVWMRYAIRVEREREREKVAAECLPLWERASRLPAVQRILPRLLEERGSAASRKRR